MRQLRLQGEATPFGSQSALVIEPDPGILPFSLPFYLLLLDLGVLRRHWVTPLGCPGMTPPPLCSASSRTYQNVFCVDFPINLPSLLQVS